MKAFSKNFVLLLMPLLVFFVVYIGDTVFKINTGVVEVLAWLRELLLIGAIAGLVPLLSSIKSLNPGRTTKKFRVLLFTVISFFVVFIIHKYILVPIFGTLTGYALISIMYSFLSIIGLIQIRDLIYFKRRKNTGKVFAMLIISIALVSIYGGLSSKDFQQILNIVMIPIGFAIFNSFRVSWIAYLSKGQKYIVLLVCIILVAGSYFLRELINGSSLYEYSYSIEIFVHLATSSFSIYTFFAMVGLLLHLPTATLFDRKIRDIESLQSLSRAVSSVLDVDKLTDMISEFTAQYSNSQYSWLVLREPEDDAFYLMSSHGLTEEQQNNMNFRIDEGTSGLIYKSGEPLISQDVAKEESTKHLKVWNSGIKSLIGYPLISEAGVIGILYAGMNEEYGYDNDDIDLIGAFSNHIVIALENAKLVEGSIERERLEHELRLAHEVQLNLLPKGVPDMPDDFDIAAASMPANEVGGDYFDFIEIDKNRIGLVIGDVSGKGTSAAFYMAEIKGMIQAFSRIYDSPKKILCDVNRALYGNMDSRSFISLTYAIVDTKKHKMKYSRAGHMPILRYMEKENEWSELEPKGIGLGMDKGDIFDKVIEEAEIKLKGDELYFFYTDGASDAMNSDQEEFGEDNLRKSLTKHYHLNCEEIKANLINDVWNHIGKQDVHDDITMIIMKIK